MVRDLGIKLLVVWSQLGGGAVYLSQQRLSRPILACSPSPAILRRLSLLYGLTPVHMAPPDNVHTFLQTIDTLLLEKGWVAPGEPIAVVTGEPITKIGITNQVNIHYVGETLSGS